MTPHHLIINHFLASGLTVTELARRTNIPRTSLARLLAGRGNPTSSTLQAIADAIDVEFCIRKKPVDVFDLKNHPMSNIIDDLAQSSGNRLYEIFVKSFGKQVVDDAMGELTDRAIKNKTGKPGWHDVENYLCELAIKQERESAGSA